MKWDDIGQQPCSIARTLSVVGDRWTMLIIRNAFMGLRRFDDFQENLGVTRHVLSERLKRLVENEILQKVQHLDRADRFEYRLTEKGMQLYPILLSMTNWADQWMDQGLGAPVQYQHKTCAKIFQPLLICSECGETIQARQVSAIFTDAYYQAVQKQKQA